MPSMELAQHRQPNCGPLRASFGFLLWASRCNGDRRSPCASKYTITLGSCQIGVDYFSCRWQAAGRRPGLLRCNLRFAPGFVCVIFAADALRPLAAGSDGMFDSSTDVERCIAVCLATGRRPELGIVDPRLASLFLGLFFLLVFLWCSYGVLMEIFSSQIEIFHISD